MSPPVTRLRMFAGPNGSGKTTVKQFLQKPNEWFGVYINPDELEAEALTNGTVSLVPFSLMVHTEELRDHFAGSSLLRRHGLTDAVKRISCRDSLIDFGGIEFNSYHASALADFLRQKALLAPKSFSFETVMSSPDKIQLLQKARTLGFRTYLYYIATEDPAVNVQRVKNRVASGGHNVPEIKIVERHARSLGLLYDALRLTDRAFLFDTSEENPWYFAEVTDGMTIDLKSDEIPNWFMPVWDRF